MEQIKILHLASWYPSKAHSSLGNFVEKHIDAIAQTHSSSILYATAYHESRIEFDPKRQSLIIYYKKYIPILSYYLAIRKGFKFLKSKGLSFDLIHIHVGFPASLFIFKTNIPYLITEHFSGYQKSRKHNWTFLQKFLLKRAFNKARLVCPVSNQLADSLREFGIKTRMFPISNTVNTRIFKPSSQEKNTRIRFLHISTLQNDIKNVTGILNAFSALAKEAYNFELAIGGDGDIDWLKSEIAKRAFAKDQVQILEEMSTQGVATEMQDSDCFVLFSNIENQPVVLLEALCCGIPVISSDVGGISEFVNEERGILVEAKNEQQLKEAVKTLLHGFDFPKDKVITEMQNLCSAKAIQKAYSKAYSIVLQKGA